jgi:hypothetical protein
MAFIIFSVLLTSVAHIAESAMYAPPADYALLSMTTLRSRECVEGLLKDAAGCE